MPVPREPEEPAGDAQTRRLREMLAARSPALLGGAGGPPPAPRAGGGRWREMVEMARAAYGPELSAAAMMTDRHRRRHSYLRISVTEKCNLRCTYCMPEEGVELTEREHLMSSGEVLRVARLFAEAGVSKIRLTGGEPTVRRDLPALVGALAALPGVEEVGITSNGLVLGRMLGDLKAAGLRKLNVSLDTLREDRFERMTRRKGLGRVLSAIRDAVALGVEEVKVNVVVMRGENDDEVGGFVDLARDLPVNVRFIEWMPFDGNRWDHGRMVPFAEMRARVERHLGAPLERLPDPRGEVAKNFRAPGHAGTVSFVTSMSEHFCGDCNRVRLMADGNLKVCLFGHTEVSLRDAVREGATDEELRYVVAAAIDRKRARHAGMFEIARQSRDGRAMVKIGG